MVRDLRHWKDVLNHDIGLADAPLLDRSYDFPAHRCRDVGELFVGDVKGEARFEICKRIVTTTLSFFGM